MDETLTKRLNIAIGAVFVVAAGILVFMAIARQEEDDTTTHSATNTAEVASPLNTADYESLKTMTKVSLAEHFESWTPDAKISASKTIAKQLVVKGEISKAYLLAKASEGGDSLTRWDSFFFKLNSDGGHMFRPLSLPVPPAQGTTLLYDLKNAAILPSVPYDENRTPDHADMFALLKDGKTVNVTSFISSLRQSSIDELSLYYSCKENSKCSLTLK